MMKWLQRLDRLPKKHVAAAAISMTLAIGAFDYATHTDVSLAAFYLVPVSLAALCLSARFAVLISLFGVAVWAGSGMLAGDEDFAFGQFIFWWNGAVQLAICLLMIWALTSLRLLQRSLEARAEERAAVLTQEITERERLQRELLDISEREQRRIGQDLHDGLCQHLAGTALAGQVLSEKLSCRGLKEAEEAGKVVELIEQGIAISHELARGLHPVETDREGLSRALHQLAEVTRGQFRTNCTFQSANGMVVKDAVVAENLYRIAQEAVRNAVKHGRARSIVIRLAENQGVPVLTITDDGTGLSSEDSKRRGMGLRIMEHRSHVIDGKFEIAPRSEGRGTIVTVTLPPRVALQGGNREYAAT